MAADYVARQDDTVTVWYATADRANHRAPVASNAIMWLILARAPLPDAIYWPGRRLLAFADAVVWPASWIAIGAHLPQPAGIVGSMVVVVALLSAIGRAHRAVWQNHRYHFTTCRCARILIGLLLIGLTLPFVTPP